MNQKIIKSKIAPHDKNVLWFDTNNNTLKIFDSGWKSVQKEVVREVLNENIESKLITKDDILNSSGTIKSEILPSYVDDILEYDNLNSFPANGETGKIYLAKDSGWAYRWGGSKYTIVSTGSDVIATNYETFERLRTTASLQPGKLYRYKFKTKYRENGIDYDDTEEYTIYVRAVANNTVDERIVIHLHPSWEVRYIPKLGSTAVEWSRADDMGQIIYLKDEHGNSAGFDWKNIKMTNKAGNRNKLFSGDNLDVFPFRNVLVQHTNKKLPNSMIYSLSDGKGLCTGLKDTVLYIENSILYIREDGILSDDQITYFTSLNNNVALINSNVTIYDESQSLIIEEVVIKDSIVSIDTLSKVPKIKNSVVSVINSKLSSIENVGTHEKGIYFNGQTNTSNNSGEWLFEEGKITNTAGKGYGTGKEDTMKFSANVDFTINFSTLLQSVTISGYNNYDTADAYLNINGSTYSFPKKNSDGSYNWKSYSINFTLTDSVSFKFTGNLCCVKFEFILPEIEEEICNKSEYVQADWEANNGSDPLYIRNRTHYMIGQNSLSTSYEGQFECRVISSSDSYAEFSLGVIAESNRTTLKNGDKYYVVLYGYSTILTYYDDTLSDQNGKIEVYTVHISGGYLLGQLDLRVPELASLVGMKDLLRITIEEIDDYKELDEIYIPRSIKKQIDNNKSNIDVNTGNIEKLLDNLDLSYKYFYIDTGTTSGYITNPNALLLYSVDGINWSGASKNSKVYIRGKKYIRYNGEFSGSLSLGTFKVDVSFTIGGNILSLISSDANNYYVSRSFANLFSENTNLTSAANLIIPKDIVMGEYAFSNMFKSCPSLKYPPKLPMLNLEHACYVNMFALCDSLLEAPELPALSIPQSGYESMFRRCTKLEIAPELPAVSIGASGYASMFSGCNMLTKGPSILPAPHATSDNQYYSMFDGCDLKESPIIYAKSILGHNSMANMFRSNTQLSRVTILATEIKTGNNLLNLWLIDTSFSGTFIKHPDATSWPTSTSGCPLYWKVVNYYPLEEIDNVKKEIQTAKSDIEKKINRVDVLSNWDINSETDKTHIKNRTHYIKNTKIEVKDFTTVLSTQNGAESDNGNATDGNGTSYKQGDYFYISQVTNTDYVPSLEETGLSLGKIYRVILGRNLEYFPDMPDDNYSGADYIIGELKLTEFEGRSIYYIGDLDTAVSPGNLVDGNIYITGHPFILSIVKWGGMSIAGFTDTLSTTVWYNLKYGGEDSIYVDIRIDEVTDYDIEYEYKTLDNGYLNLDSEVSETSDNPVTSAAVYKALLDKTIDTYTKEEIDTLITTSITTTLNTEI